MQSNQVRSRMGGGRMRSMVSVLGVVFLAVLGLMVPASPVAAAPDASPTKVTKAEPVAFPNDIEAEIEKLRELIPLLHEALVALSSSATEAVSEASAAGGEADVSKLLTGLGPNAKELRPMLVEVASSLGHVVEAIVAGRVAAAAVLDTILAIAKPLLSFVVKFLPTILPSVVPLLAPILNFLANNLATLLGPVVSFACVALKTFLPSFATVITTTCDSIAKLIPSIAPFLASILKFLATAIPSLSGLFGSTPTTAKPGAAVSPRSNLPETGSSMPLGTAGASLLGLAGLAAVLRRRSLAVSPLA